MPFKKGQSGNPKGKKLGVKNKNTIELRAEADIEYPNFNPYLELVKYYHESKDPTLKLSALKEICKKVMPDMKAVDVVTDGKSLNPTAIIQLIGNPPTD